jgi:tripartite-type tricarboxylate transporter receptor subunit TctC
VNLSRLVNVTGIAFALFASVAIAQSYPSRTVRLLVGTSPGSASDLIGRAVADRLQAGLGQTVIVENRLGAGGMLAATAVANSEPDGHTINVAAAAFTVYPFINRPPWDALRDFTAVASLASIANVVIVAPNKGWKSMNDLVAAAKANPGKLNYASAGSGSSTHMGAEKFRFAAGYDAVHVPYKGSPEALADVMAGRVDYFFAPLVSALTLIKDGKVNALAVGTGRRASALPDVPTTIEAGFPGSAYNFWVGLIVPSKTPREIVARLHEEANKALQSPEVKERIARMGADVLSMSQAEFQAMIKQDLEDNAKLAQAAGLKPN